MAVKIRLTRMGKKKEPSYRVVVMDSRKPRDGAYIEQIGRYDPRQDPSLVEIDNDRALDWLNKGAQPTDRARKLLEISGAWTRFRVAKGDIHTVDDITPAAVAAAQEPAAEPTPEAAPEPTPVILDDLRAEAAEAAAEAAAAEAAAAEAAAAEGAASEAAAEGVEDIAEQSAEETT